MSNHQQSLPINDIKCTVEKVGITTFWKVPTKTMQWLPIETLSMKFNTTNTFDALQNDILYESMQYKFTLLLNSTTVDSVYADINTIVCK